MKRLIFLAVAAAFVLSLGCGAQAKSVTLVHKFENGQTDKYRFSMIMKMALPDLPVGPQSMTLKMSTVLKQKVLHVMSDGSAQVQVSFSDLTISCPEFPQAQTQNVPSESMSMTMTLSSDGRLLSIDEMDAMPPQAQIPGLDFSQIAGQIGYYGVFPQGPVAIGESWRSTIPMPFGCGELSVDSTLLAAALPVGNEVASKIKQTYEAYIDFGKMMQAVASSDQVPADAAQIATSMDGGMDMVGWTVLYFSPDHGKLLKANGNLKAIVSISLPAEAVAQGAPPQMNMKMDMDLNMARI